MADILRFVQIAAAGDELYGLTEAGEVFRYIPTTEVWLAIKMRIRALDEAEIVSDIDNPSDKR